MKSEFINYYTKGSKHWNLLFRRSLEGFLNLKGVIKQNNQLENLHNEIDQKYFSFDTIGEQNNSRPKISDLGFDFMMKEQKLYYDFLKWIRKVVVKKNFYFQKTPTI